jgi:hypothetical protein
MDWSEKYFIAEDIYRNLTDDITLTAQNVNASAYKTQTQIRSFYGSLTDHRAINSDRISPGMKITFKAESSEYSYIFDGLENNEVTVIGKINHLLVRKCQKTDFILRNGTVSGIDILHSGQLTIKVPYHNYSNFEFVERCHIYGNVDEHSRIILHHCLDVNINQQLMSSHFNRTLYTTTNTIAIPGALAKTNINHFSPPPQMTVSLSSLTCPNDNRLTIK